MRAPHSTTDHPSDQSHLDVQDAAARAATGDTEALASLYNHYAAKVVRFFITRVHDSWLAEDLAHDTWANVARSISSFKRSPTSDFTSWLFTIARNVQTDGARRAIRRPETLQGDWLEIDAPHDGDTPEHIASRHAVARALAKAVNELPGAQPTILTHLFFTGLSIAETAAVTGKSAGAIRKARHDGLKNLRARMGGLDFSDLLAS